MNKSTTAVKRGSIPQRLPDEDCPFSREPVIRLCLRERLTYGSYVEDRIRDGVQIRRDGEILSTALSLGVIEVIDRMRSTDRVPVGVEAAVCTCDFRADPTLHNRLTAMESLPAPYAAELIASVISDDDPGTGSNVSLFSDSEGFERFVAQHNWSDPVGMYLLAGGVRFAAGQAEKGRRVSR